MVGTIDELKTSLTDDILFLEEKNGGIKKQTINQLAASIISGAPGVLNITQKENNMFLCFL